MELAQAPPTPGSLGLRGQTHGMCSRVFPTCVTGLTCSCRFGEGRVLLGRLGSQGQCSCDSWGSSPSGCPRLPPAHPSPLFRVACQRLWIQEVPSKVGAAIFPKRKLLNKYFAPVSALTSCLRLLFERSEAPSAGQGQAASPLGQGQGQAAAPLGQGQGQGQAASPLAVGCTEVGP